jgi:hypothetical protein
VNAASFTGELLLRDDDGYEAARTSRVFNRRWPIVNLPVC